MEDMVKYLYEIGQLKRVKRSGWWVVGIKDPESVAEHSFRTAIIGYILAQMEGADAQKTTTLCLFHDTPEARINDLHKTAKRYIKSKESEKEALAEQLAHLPSQTAEILKDLFQEYEEKRSLEAQLAHDADMLEGMIQAREYQVQGFVDLQEWIDNFKASLQTEAAKRLAETCLYIEPKNWWQGLK